MSRFEDVYQALRAIMIAAAPGQVVARDAPGDLLLRTRTLDPKTGEGGWFGTVTVKKSYVAYHLMPLYDRPDLVAAIPPGLEPRRQGKTCFNFTRIDPERFQELERLTRLADAG